MEIENNLSVPVLIGTAIAVTVAVLVYLVQSNAMREKPWPGFEVITVRGKDPKTSYSVYGRETLVKGLQQCPGPFQVMAGYGPIIVLPNRFADEIRNEPWLEFSKGIKADFFPNYPGFDAFKEGLEPDSVSMEAIRTKLTPSLGLVTDDLVEETINAVHNIYGENDDWQTISIKDSTLDLVARTTSRVFLGKDLCTNERWIDIVKSYTINCFSGAFALRRVPTLLRPIRYKFIPQLTKLRNTVQEARGLVDAEVSKQARMVDEAVEAGRKPPKLVNTLRWMYEIAKGRKVDYTGAQLAFSLVAMGAQSALHAQAIINICARPELAQQLREEIIAVVGEYGFQNAGLHRLELMDSYIKELQRLYPANAVSMSRYANKSVQLSDGTILPKGCRLVVCADSLNPEIYPEPEKFDAARYMKMRQEPGKASKWQLAAVDASNMGFGLGRHACPGRFFAVHHIKISLCHLLLKYDWKFMPNSDPAEYDFEETVRRIKPSFKVQYRRREEEINLDIF